MELGAAARLAAGSAAARAPSAELGPFGDPVDGPVTPLEGPSRSRVRPRRSGRVRSHERPRNEWGVSLARPAVPSKNAPSSDGEFRIRGRRRCPKNMRNTNGHDSDSSRGRYDWKLFF